MDIVNDAEAGYQSPTNLTTVNPLIIGADNYNLASEGKSWFSSFGDAMTLGVHGAVLAGLNSFINTGVQLGNFFGADLHEKDTYQQLLESNVAAADYYSEHRSGVELAGFLAGSFIPGLTGIKALQLAKAGVAGEKIASAAGLFSAPRNAIINETVNLVSSGAQGIEATVRANKYKAIALGFGDQALQAATWETAVAASMGASPILETADWKDIGLNILTGSVLGGSIGGVFDAFGALGTFKKAQLAADFKARPYEYQVNLGRGDYLAGDRVIGILESIDSIPLPAPQQFTGKVAATYKTAVENAKLELAKIADDNEVSNSLFDVLLKLRDEAGLSKDELYERMAGLTKIERTGVDAHVDSPKFYFKDGDLENIVSNERGANDKHAYQLRDANTPPIVSRFVDSATGGESSVGQYKTAKDAWAGGADVWISTDLKTYVNPGSKNLKKVPIPGQADFQGKTGATIILDTTTGRLSNTAYSVAGDIAASDTIKLTAGGTALRVGDHATYHYSPAGGRDYYKAEDYLEASSRFIWASQRGILKGDIIDSSDLPMLDTLLASVNKQDDKFAKILQTVKIKDADGNLAPVESILPDLKAYIQEQKKAVFNELATKEGGKLAPNGLPIGRDLREIAARLNTTLEYLSNGLPNNAAITDFSPDAARLAKPMHAKLTFDIGEIKTPDGMIARGMIPVIARIQRAKDQANNVFADFVRGDAPNFPEIDPYTSQQNANSLGAGASGFGSANASYGSVGEMYESIGAGTKLLSTNRIKLTNDTLAPVMGPVFTDAKLTSQYGIIENILRGSAEKYVLRGDYLVLRKAVNNLKLIQGKAIFDDTVDSVLPAGYLSKVAGEQGSEITAKGKYAAYKLSPEVRDLYAAEVGVNDGRLVQHNKWLAAQGRSNFIETGTVYPKPIDTRKYAYFALVREPAGHGASSSSVAALTASNDAELAQLIGRAKDQGLEVFTKNDIKRYHQIQDDYDYNMNMVQNTVDSTLKREGILSNYFPETKADRLTDDLLTWHRNQETRLVRNMVELKYGQQFAELRQLGEQYTSIATSKFQNISQYLSNTAQNPYNDYIKTALDISKKSEYRLWQDANEKVEAFFDTAFNTARDMFAKVRAGKAEYEDITRETQKFGLGNPYSTMADYLVAQKMLTPTPYLRQFVQKANGILAATTIRIDQLNAIVNIISTPILLGAEVSSIRNNLKDPAIVGELNALMHMSVEGVEMPATTKLLYRAVGNYFGPNKEILLKQYQAAGYVKDLIQQQHEMLDTLAFTGREDAKSLSAKISKASDLGAKITGNNFAEEFTRFISADVMRQITEVANLPPDIARAYIRTFVNRVQGNYIASQRPIVFQGVLGQAMGLFQTYQFNMMQQMFRHIENGDSKTIATLLGLQGTLYGFQGLPLFAAINTHIIGNAPGNPTHTDAYLAIPRLVGKDVGDFLLYGGASWASGTALYSRGDINPRNITVLPINPADWPAVDGTIRFVKNLYDMTSKIANGGNVLTSMLNGLEHNSISRPLAGFAQVVQGYATTSQGSLISAQEVSNIANASRLMGSKPLDEAIALDAEYRSTAYTAKDGARIKSLGEAVKSTLYNGGMPTDAQIDKFATEYAASGGRIQNFNAFFVEMMQSANGSVVNKMANKLNSPISRNMQEIMGGKRLPDFLSATSSDGQK